MNAYELNSSLSPFEKWTAGQDLFSSLNHQDDSGDTIIDGDFRMWAEECDAIQGVHVFGGTDDAWGGFGAKYVEGLRDEFGLKSAIWIWGLEEGFGKNVCLVAFTLPAGYGDHDLIIVADRAGTGYEGEADAAKGQLGQLLVLALRARINVYPTLLPNNPLILATKIHPPTGIRSRIIMAYISFVSHSDGEYQLTVSSPSAGWK